MTETRRAKIDKRRESLSTGLFLVIEIANGPFSTAKQDCKVVFVTDSKAWAVRKRNKFERECETGMSEQPFFNYHIFEVK